MCRLPYNCHFHSQWAACATQSCVSHSCIVRTCVDRDSTIWFFILFYFTLVAEPRSSASSLDRSTQQGELRSSAMSGGTDRREDEQTPILWPSTKKLVEFKVEDRDRLGPRLYRRGLHGQPKITVKTKLHKILHSSQWTTSLNASKTTGMENFLNSLDKRHAFSVREHWRILARERRISRDEKNLESRSSLRGRHNSRRSRRPSPRRLLQRNVRKSGMISVRQGPPWWIR